jgi:Rrf2 family nitric oxide-sensitive transcriptional repressor
MKVVQKLTKSGFLTAIRGRSGGVVLGCAADRIRLGDVLRVMEEDFNIVECFAALVPDAASAADKTQGACVITAPCKLKHILHAALQAFLDVMDSYTLADLNVRNENLLAALQLDEYV